jgi:hypothetical protein
MRPAPRKSQGKAASRRSRPHAVNGTVPPQLAPYSKRQKREYLTVKEIELLMDTARKRGRYCHSDATMILVGYRHGLRAAELCARSGGIRSILGVGPLGDRSPTDYPRYSTLPLSRL